jgi:hypothetical protein
VQADLLAGVQQAGLQTLRDLLRQMQMRAVRGLRGIGAQVRILLARLVCLRVPEAAEREGAHQVSGGEKDLLVPLGSGGRLMLRLRESDGRSGGRGQPGHRPITKHA